MTACTFHDQIEPYFDGELDPAASGRIESHLAGCLQCQLELKQLRAIGAKLLIDSLPGAPATAVARWHGLADAASAAVRRHERAGMMRIARIVVAVAAVLLVVAVCRLIYQPRDTGGGMPSPGATTAIETRPSGIQNVHTNTANFVVPGNGGSTHVPAGSRPTGHGH